MIALFAAAALTLTLQQPAFVAQPAPFAQVTPSDPRPGGHFIDPKRTEGEQKVDSSKDRLVERRTAAWVAAGGFGMSGIGAGIGGVMAQAIYRSTNPSGDYSDQRQGTRGMVLGMLIGLLPGLIFGDDARNESNGLGRQVIVLLDLGGALATAFAVVSIKAH